MTDKELLELVAKAAGYKDIDFEDPINGWYSFGHDENGDVKAWWNPLADDGDALRLAVKLDMDIVYDFDRVMAVFGNKDGTCITEYFYEKPEPTNRYAATRRAIVRAAAEIGKEMK